MSNNKDTLGDRIKRYEQVSNYRLSPKTPVIIRIDGKAFHTFTRGLEKPYSQVLIDTMVKAAEHTAENMMGFKLAYVQSDEASFLLTDLDSHETQPWFNYELNKIVSISASLFTAYFNREWDKQFSSDRQDENYWDRYGEPALFDSRAFNVPDWDAPNAFLWRQRDWERNSIQMLARAYFSHKECESKNVHDLQLMLAKGNHPLWGEQDDQLKYGTWILKNGTNLFSRYDYDGVKELCGIES